MFNRRVAIARPFSLGALLAMAFGGLGMPERLPRGFGEKRTKATPRWRPRRGDKLYHVINAQGKRVPLPPGSKRPACKWVPNVAGFRWEKGVQLRRGGGRKT